MSAAPGTSPGSQRSTVSSSVSLPSPASCSTTVATNVLVTLPTRKRSRAHGPLRREPFVSADELHRAPALAHERDRAGRPTADDGVERVLELGSIRTAGRCAGRRGHRGRRKAGERDRAYSLCASGHGSRWKLSCDPSAACVNVMLPRAPSYAPVPPSTATVLVSFAGRTMPSTAIWPSRSLNAP